MSIHTYSIIINMYMFKTEDYGYYRITLDIPVY